MLAYIKDIIMTIVRMNGVLSNWFQIIRGGKHWYKII